MSSVIDSGSPGDHSSSSSAPLQTTEEQRTSSLPDVVLSVLSSTDFHLGLFLFPALFLLSRAFFAFIFRIDDDDDNDDNGNDKRSSRRRRINGHVPDSHSAPQNQSHPKSRILSDDVRRLAFNSKNFLAVRFVSSLQAVFACVCACVILNACAHDVIYANHWMTKFYARVATPYFLYDIWAMFQAFKEERTNLTASSISSSDAEEDRLQRATSFRSFLRENALIIVHHLFVPFCLFPGVVGPWRRDRGDVIIACFFLLEASTPFVSARAILHKVGLAKSKGYVVNGLLMLVVFGFCRILIFPFIYWIYSRRNITGESMPLWRVPFAIPLHCNISCIALFALQFHWFLKMLRGAIKLVSGKKRGEVTSTLTALSTSAHDHSVDSKLASASNNNNDSSDNKNAPAFASERRINQSINQKLVTLPAASSFTNATECPSDYVKSGNLRTKTD